MTRLPTGTVTFFFSDIEGSTRLLEALGDRYDALLDRHREIVRGAFRRHGVVEVGTQGDSFFAAVPTADGAVAASVGIQRAIGAERWSDVSGAGRTNGSATLRIRIGLHTGEGRVAANDYVGLDVHRAARIMSAAHGGQIVASEATRAQARRDLDPAIALRDLGEHRLKDLSAPEHLYQVVADGLGVEFPPLRTLDRTPNNLPTQPSPLIGRTRELAQIRSLLDAGRTRLITLTGPGGIGKTRLALQAAADQIDRIDHGVWFVDLSTAADADAALQELARVLRASVAGSAELRTALAEHIGERNLLLVLDNVEHVIAAADDVADLLRLCPRLIVLGNEPRGAPGPRRAAAADRTTRDPRAAGRTQRCGPQPNSRRSNRSACSSNGRPKPGPSSSSPTRTRRSSPTSACASRASRSRSSSRPPGCGCSRCPNCAIGSAAASTCSAAAHATCRSASARCATRSSGATTCSTRMSVRSSRCSRSSPGPASTPSSGSPTGCPGWRASTSSGASNRSSTRASSAASPTARDNACRCWARSATSPPSASPPIPTARPPRAPRTPKSSRRTPPRSRSGSPAPTARRRSTNWRSSSAT